MTTSNVLKANLSQCSLVPDESRYWDVFSSWQPLFKNGRKKTDFFFRKKIKAGISYVTLKVNLFYFLFNSLLQKRFRTLSNNECGAFLLSQKSSILLVWPGFEYTYVFFSQSFGCKLHIPLWNKSQVISSYIPHYILLEKRKQWTFTSNINKDVPMLRKSCLFAIPMTFILSKVFKNGPSKICGGQPLKNLKWCKIIIPCLFANVYSFKQLLEKIQLVDKKKQVVREKTTNVVKAPEDIGGNLIKWFSDNQMKLNTDTCHVLLNSQGPNTIKEIYA